jgi:hypothetical protein
MILNWSLSMMISAIAIPVILIFQALSARGSRLVTLLNGVTLLVAGAVAASVFVGTNEIVRQSMHLWQPFEHLFEVENVCSIWGARAVVGLLFPLFILLTECSLLRDREPNV